VGNGCAYACVYVCQSLVSFILKLHVHIYLYIYIYIFMFDITIFHFSYIFATLLLVLDVEQRGKELENSRHAGFPPLNSLSFSFYSFVFISTDTTFICMVYFMCRI
jgi:hypothetical protein